LEDRAVTCACQYAVIRFLPFVETEEFSNLGVVLVCPERRFFGSLVSARGWRRISAFFAPLDRRFYRAAVDRLEEELANVEATASRLSVPDDVDRLWTMLTRRRDGIIRYSAPRVVLAKEPASALADLFRRYVERDFVADGDQERRLEQTVREALESAALIKHFKRAQLGNEDFHVVMPFVEFADGVAQKAIKPLHLSQDEPTRILNHGGDWLQRLHRLRKRRVLPPKLLIAVSPPGDMAYRDEAFAEVCGDFAAQDFLVANVEDRTRIADFARAPVIAG
jgi:hypothetical protein